MTDEIKESVFTMFRNITRRPNELDEDLSSNLQAQTRGAGLGLTFCKQMIERLGGSIRFESEHNKGSTFYLKFPIKIASKADLKGNQTVSEKSIESILIEKLDRLRMRARENKRKSLTDRADNRDNAKNG